MINDGQGLNEPYETQLKEYLDLGETIADFECEYYGCECECEFEKYRPIFIHDCLWTNKNFRMDNSPDENEKNGYYVYSKIDLKLFINDIFDVMDMVGTHFNDYSRGIIMFMNSDMNVAQMLKDYQYNCMYGNPDTSLLFDETKFGCHFNKSINKSY